MAKNKGTELATWDKDLAAMADVAAKEVATSITGQFISIKAGVLHFNGQPMHGNQMAAVVVAHTHEHALYREAFDPSKPASPICFAFGEAEKEMTPHEASLTRQHDKCESCPMNKFPSREEAARTGKKGKPCKNMMRLGLIVAGTLEGSKFSPITDPEHYATSPVAYLRVPVTSVKLFASFVTQMKEIKRRPPCAVFVKIAPKPDPKSQFLVTFEYLDPLPGSPLIPALLSRHKEVQEIIGFPYQGAAETEETTAPKRNKKC